ncbi:hypothetical protein RFI_17981, partial [Reticulomyxa filosa]
GINLNTVSSSAFTSSIVSSPSKLRKKQTNEQNYDTNSKKKDRCVEACWTSDTCKSFQIMNSFSGFNCTVMSVDRRSDEVEFGVPSALSVTYYERKHATDQVYIELVESTTMPITTTATATTMVYVVVKYQLTWKEAEKYCREIGRHLVSVHDDIMTEELLSLWNQSGLSANAFWIGLHQETDEQWQWTDNSTLNYTYWWPGEPNNYGNAEDCVELRFQSNGTLEGTMVYGWNDLDCDSTLRYAICGVPTIRQCSDMDASVPSGVYGVNPGQGVMDVYCNMDTDGGGWTLVGKEILSAGTLPLLRDLSQVTNDSNALLRDNSSGIIGKYFQGMYDEVMIQWEDNNNNNNDYYIAFEFQNNEWDLFDGQYAISKNITHVRTNNPIIATLMENSQSTFATFCRAVNDTYKPGGISWAFLPNLPFNRLSVQSNSENEGCGCVQNATAGGGLFYGGYSLDQCTDACQHYCDEGKFTGPMLPGQNKLGQQNTSVRIFVRQAPQGIWSLVFIFFYLLSCIFTFTYKYTYGEGGHDLWNNAVIQTTVYNWVFVKSSRNWRDAETYCENLGRTLLSIHSATQQQQ